MTTREVPATATVVLASGQPAIRTAAALCWVNAIGFGVFTIPAIARVRVGNDLPIVLGFPAYGRGPFEAHGVKVDGPVACRLPRGVPRRGGRRLAAVARPSQWRHRRHRSPPGRRRLLVGFCVADPTGVRRRPHGADRLEVGQAPLNRSQPAEPEMGGAMNTVMQKSMRAANAVAVNLYRRTNGRI